MAAGRPLSIGLKMLVKQFLKAKKNRRNQKLCKIIYFFGEMYSLCPKPFAILSISRRQYNMHSMQFMFLQKCKQIPFDRYQLCWFN